MNNDSCPPDVEPFANCMPPPTMQSNVPQKAVAVAACVASSVNRKPDWPVPFGA